MKRICTGLAFLVWMSTVGWAQSNITGFWLGVTYPTDPDLFAYNYTMTITQAGTTLSGTAQTANPSVPFGGTVLIQGNTSGTVVTYNETDQSGSTAVKSVCFWRGTLTYNPTDESLTGTYENITNGTTCTMAGGGKVELYRIVLKSDSSFCKNTRPTLTVTGKAIRWYSSPAKTTLLATGNSYTPTLSQTTTFYITQTLYQSESPPIPVTIRVKEPAFTAKVNNTGCDKSSGAIEVTGASGQPWQYQLNGGPYQNSPVFPSLTVGTYTIGVKDAQGCQASQQVTITNDPPPNFSGLNITPPRCETANGQISATATGKTPLTFSIDYGVTFQTSSVFTNLPGGTYTVRVRDANGCEVNKAASLPPFTPMLVQSLGITPTSCGQANGRVSLSTAGGTNPVQYRIDNGTYQPTAVFSGLAAGAYTLTARDADGCTIGQSINIAPSSGPEPVLLSISEASCGENDGALYLTSTSATATQYALDGQTFQTATQFTGLHEGDYTLTIRDADQCLTTQPVHLTADCATVLHLPTAFSPNRDAMNDALTARFPFASLTISRFTVYDRWGSAVYNRANFALSSGETLWNGQLADQPAPAGVYAYQLEGRFPDGTPLSYRSSVVLLP